MKTSTGPSFIGDHLIPNNPSMNCPCRGCIYSGRFGGDAAKPGFLCPYNKRVAFKALEDINGILCALSSLVNDISIALGISLKRDQGFFDFGDVSKSRVESPIERMEQKTAMRCCEPGISSEVE